MADEYQPMDLAEEYMQNGVMAARTGLTDQEYMTLFRELLPLPIHQRQWHAHVICPEHTIVSAYLTFLHERTEFVDLARSIHQSVSFVDRMIHAMNEHVYSVLSGTNEIRFPPTLIAAQANMSPAFHAQWPNVVGIVDATEIKVPRPGREPQQRLCYSGKSKSHCYKVQLVCAPNGVIYDVSNATPGSTHDVTLCRTHRTDELLPLAYMDAQFMADKGFQGMGPSFVLPHRRPPHGHLTDAERAYNDLIARDRVVVENVFAAVKRYKVAARWPLSVNTDEGARMLHHAFYVCCVLTNRHIRAHPLR